MFNAKIVIKRALDRLNKFDRRSGSLPWGKVGYIIVQSIKENFDAGGRPIKWPERKKPVSWPILQKSGKLKGGTYVEPIPDGRAFGNRVEYQAVHNFGYPERNIPQRKYHFAQDEDIKKAKAIFKQHLKI